MRALSPMFVVIMLVFIVLSIVFGGMAYFGYKQEEENKRGPKVAISAEMRACKTDGDCEMVNTACNGCCGEAAIARAQEKPFNVLFGRTCKATKIEVCDCGFGPRKPVCRKDGCVLEEVSSSAGPP